METGSFHGFGRIFFPGQKSFLPGVAGADLDRAYGKILDVHAEQLDLEAAAMRR